jgi:hypothetical protein
MMKPEHKAEGGAAQCGQVRVIERLGLLAGDVQRASRAPAGR